MWIFHAISQRGTSATESSAQNYLENLYPYTTIFESSSSGLDEQAIHREVVPIRRLCQLYDVPLEYRHFEGNPIEHLLAESQHHQLMVLARSHGRTDNYFNPDVALRLARKAHCSVLVLTLRPED